MPHSCQGEVDQIASGLAGAPAAASAQRNAAQAASATAPTSGVTAAASCSTKVIFVLHPGHGGRAARATLSETTQLEPYDGALKAGTLSQTDYNNMFDLSGSYFNNASGALSNILEKTMPHRPILLVRDKINAQKGDIIRRGENLDDIEVHLTKTDEFVNMSCNDRATFTHDKKADFFLLLPF